MVGVLYVMAEQRYIYISYLIPFFKAAQTLYLTVILHKHMFKQKGQTGFCDGTDYDDVDYDEETPDDVSYFKSWGYCDDKCHVSVRDLGATVLQEVSGNFHLLLISIE